MARSSKVDFLNIRKEPSDAYALGIMLAIVGGFLDAHTYINNGHVFANAQTGNIVLFAINLASANYGRMIHYLIPILSFMAGIVISELVRAKGGQFHLHWRQVIILFEILTLSVISFWEELKPDILVTSAISFVSSMQINSFRHIGGNPLSTVTCTNNLRTATESFLKNVLLKENGRLRHSIQYYGIIFFFVVGAIIGYVLTSHYHGHALVFPSVLLALVFIVMFIRPSKEI